MKILRKILFPVALLYGLIMLIRNYFYSAGILKSKTFSLPVIGVGNLSTGGTGKSPAIEYLLYLLNEFKTATLSRGYGRKTSGFILLKGNESPLTVGDEPLQFKYKFPQTEVAVDANRIRGIENLRSLTSPEVVLLDDVFQHRKVKPGLNILLSTYNRLYINDVMLPTGNLREPAVGAKRADLVVITKCPENITQQEQEKITRSLKLKHHQKLFFSYIGYQKKIYSRNKEMLIDELVNREVTLVTGIANPAPLCEYLEKQQINYRHLKFPDHHTFTIKELNKISGASFILTTEKDFMRLQKFDHKNLYYIPIKMQFINGSSAFDSAIKDYLYNEK